MSMSFVTLSGTRMVGRLTLHVLHQVRFTLAIVVEFGGQLLLSPDKLERLLVLVRIRNTSNVGVQMLDVHLTSRLKAQFTATVLTNHSRLPTAILTEEFRADGKSRT